MTTTLLPVLRLILAGVFALAGITKLLDRPGATRSMQDFGVPALLAPSLAMALPVAELVVALALLPGATAIYGTIGAAALLLSFIAAVGISLLRGLRPDCHCFGQLHSAPVGWRVLARNGVLLGAAAVVIAVGWPDGGVGVDTWFGSLGPAMQTLVAASAIAVVVVTALAVRRARIRRLAPLVPDWSAMGIPVGQPAPEFSLPALDGSATTLVMLRDRGKPVVLIFSDPGCGPCAALLPDIAEWQRLHAERFTVAVVSRGTAKANLAKIGDLAIDHVLLQKDREVSKAFGIPFTPGAVVIHTDGTVGSPPAPGDAASRRLIAELIESSSAPLALGAEIRDFSLPRLDGEPISLSQFRGTDTVLLFWDPKCSFCQQLLGPVRFWEARPLVERPRLLVISKGDSPSNAAQGFHAPVVIDHGFTVGRRLGVTGTPSAVRLDAEGRLASAVATGGAAVLALIGQDDLSTLSAALPSAEAVDPMEHAFTTLPPESRPLQQEFVHDEMLEDGSLVVYNARRQQVMTLNPTAALVWTYCDGEHAVEAIVSEIAAVFPAAPRPDADVRSILDSFLEWGLIAPRFVHAGDSPGPAAR